MTTPTSWTHFGPDPAFEALPSSVQSCIAAPTPACDDVIGSAATGAGFCSLAEYAQTTYCSCVNNSLPCPQITSATCTNMPHAYRPAFWSITPANGMSPDDMCKAADICVNLANVGGDSDVVSGLMQECGNINNYTRSYNNILVAALLLVVVVALVLGLTGRQRRARGGARGGRARGGSRGHASGFASDAY